MAEDLLTLRGALLVAAGALAGGVGRWLVTVTLARAGYPGSTLLVNVVGSFLIGVLLFSAFGTVTLDPAARLLLVTGFLGAFTTMSTFAYETVVLLDSGAPGRAFLNVLLNPGLSLVACYLGFLVARALPAPGM